jgi:hypothetical protein
VSAALGDAAAESGVTSANDALDTGTSTAAPLPLTDATDPSDAIAAGGADASDAAADADAMTNRTPAVPLDEFADPWARPAPTASVR